MGKLSYFSFWTEVLLEQIKKQGKEIQVKNLSTVTCMKEEDILATLQNMNMVKYVRGEYVISTNSKILDSKLEQIRKSNISKNYNNFQPDQLVWVPPLKSK